MGIGNQVTYKNEIWTVVKIRRYWPGIGFDLQNEAGKTVTVPDCIYHHVTAPVKTEGAN